MPVVMLMEDRSRSRSLVTLLVISFSQLESGASLKIYLAMGKGKSASCKCIIVCRSVPSLASSSAIAWNVTVSGYTDHSSFAFSGALFSILLHFKATFDEVMLLCRDLMAA